MSGRDPVGSGDQKRWKGSPDGCWPEFVRSIGDVGVQVAELKPAARQPQNSEAACAHPAIRAILWSEVKP
jgi:hypothetical protein